MLRPAATWLVVLLQQRMKWAGGATHFSHPVLNPSVTTWGAYNNRRAEPAMESEWLLIGGKVIAKVLIQYDLSAPCNIPSISHERVASSLSSFNWVRPLRTCTAVKKLVSLQIELSSITFCGVSPGHRRGEGETKPALLLRFFAGNGNKLANKRTPADNFHTHAHTQWHATHMCVHQKKVSQSVKTFLIH